MMYEYVMYHVPTYEVHKFLIYLLIFFSCIVLFVLNNSQIRHHLVLSECPTCFLTVAPQRRLPLIHIFII